VTAAESWAQSALNLGAVLALMQRGDVCAVQVSRYPHHLSVDEVAALAGDEEALAGILIVLREDCPSHA
jgi:HJR/Mrr/RecB family endonuclease